MKLSRMVVSTMRLFCVLESRTDSLRESNAEIHVYVFFEAEGQEA